MKTKLIAKCAKILIGGSLLALSSTSFADHMDWTFAYDDIAGSNFGASSGFAVIDGPYVNLLGEEYLLGEFGELTCQDFEVTVTKTRLANPTGRGKELNIIDTEVVTYCQDTPVEV